MASNSAGTPLSDEGSSEPLLSPGIFTDNDCENGPKTQPSLPGRPTKSQSSYVPQLDTKDIIGTDVPQPIRGATTKDHIEGQTDGVKLLDVDPYAPRLGKGADVWKIYVDESEKWDRELSDGWNKMLDVILIFAALFSAISTAFVLESSKNLKPDPAESSAASLLAVTRILLAISNQSSPVAIAAVLEETPFSPSASAVAVNVLWFLSLILSIAVTLVSMLAKEWCHLFMAGRTGEMHDQARRRQLRLEGLERWKMAGVIPALPTLMHLALFLFSAGLCVYLWDIHIGVAIPVVLVSVISAALYLSSIILPFIYDFCPYETALSRLLKPWARTWVQAWFKSENKLKFTWYTWQDVPMDHLTSRSLSWMIKNCENPKAVDITLQSIAGADHALPFGPLFDSNAVTLIAQRVENSFASQQLSTKDVDGLAEMDPGQHQAVIVYARALDLCFSQMGKFTDLGKQVRQIVRPLDGFYSRLLNDRSIPVSAVGTIGWSLAYSRSVYGENPFGEEDTRRKVDRLSGLIEFAQTRHTRLPSHTHLLFDLLYVLSRHIFMFASKSGDDTRQIMIKGMIAALSPSSVETLRITSVAHSCAVAALGLNTSLRAHFSTLDRSLVDSSNGYLAVSGHSRIMIEDLNPECLLLLGLAGLVEAFGDSGCAGAELGILNVVMQRLNELRVDWRRQAAFEPLAPASAFDLRRYVVETVSKCYIQQLASSPSNPSVSLFQFTDVLGNILSLVWDDMSWLLDVALALRAGSPHKGLRDKIVGLLALHTEAVVQHPHIHDMLYEMFAGVGDESLGYFNSADGAYLHGITHHFHDITSTHSIDAKRVNTITISLLQRLVRDGLLETLIYCAYGADDRDLHDAFWRGIRCGPTTCFWGEQTIMLARKSVSQLGAPSDMGTRSISDLLRDFCLTQGERTHGSGGAKEVGYVRRTDEVWSRELQGHLEDFKAVLLHELNAPVHQTQPQKRLRWQTMPIAGRAILEEVNQRVDRSYIALEVLKT